MTRCRRRRAASFFFQAEDGIRDRDVTGVQTCALPIWRRTLRSAGVAQRGWCRQSRSTPKIRRPFTLALARAGSSKRPTTVRTGTTLVRSEEHTSELQSHHDLVCRLLLEKKKKHHHTRQ